MTRADNGEWNKRALEVNDILQAPVCSTLLHACLLDYGLKWADYIETIFKTSTGKQSRLGLNNALENFTPSRTGPVIERTSVFLFLSILQLLRRWRWHYLNPSAWAFSHVGIVCLRITAVIPVSSLCRLWTWLVIYLGRRLLIYRCRV